MLELGISQAQTQFTKLLNQAALIVDKKAHVKKAVILPYEEYEMLLKQAQKQKNSPKKSSFREFVGVLDNDFETEDARYKAIVQ